MTDHAVESDAKPTSVVINVIEPPKLRPIHPCERGEHRWAWLTSGDQACGYCGRPRR